MKKKCITVQQVCHIPIIIRSIVKITNTTRVSEASERQKLKPKFLVTFCLKKVSFGGKKWHCFIDVRCHPRANFFSSEISEIFVNIKFDLLHCRSKYFCFCFDV